MAKLVPISLIAVLSTALLTAGCGGSSNASDASAASEAPLTKAEFIKQGDAICEKAHQKIYDEAKKYREVHAKELEKLGGVAAEEKLIRLVMLPAVLEEAKGMEALGAPKGDDKQIESFVAAIERGVEKAKKNPMAAESEFGYGQNPFHNIDIQLREYGFEVCRIIT
jgi:hypothetical protein